MSVGAQDTSWLHVLSLTRSHVCVCLSECVVFGCCV